jgi:ferredoxin-NADP reductase
MLTEPASPSSILAIVTTVHLGLAALRNHRSSSRLPVTATAVVSFAFTALPWVMPSAVGLALGVGAHLAWFAVCELLAPAAAPEAGRPAVRRETPSVRAAAPATRAATAPPGRPAGGFRSVPILATVDEAPAIKTIRVARPDDFIFSPGQFIPVRVRVDGKELTRCYSISSAPAAQGYLEISVKRQGVVSSALHATARPGAQLQIRAPAGAFTYPTADDRPLVLIAGGIGITPLMSMARHAVAVEPHRPVTLLYSARAEAEFAFRDELECLARRHPQFRLQLAATQGATSPCVYPGRIDASLLRAAAPALRDSIACR